MSLDNGWIPAKINPFGDGDYIVYCPTGATPRHIRHYSKALGWEDGVVITHWQPLPFPPTGAGPALKPTQTDTVGCYA